MLKQASLPDLFNVTSSLDSAAGATPCALPDGPRIDLFGRAVAPANPSAQPVPGGGVTDERHLWPTWFNLIRECRPGVIFGEQVEAAINHGWLDLVQSDLEGEGYACGAVGLPAGGVGAPHIRQRLWFVADAVVGGRASKLNARGGNASISRGEADGQSDCGVDQLADTTSNGHNDPTRSSNIRQVEQRTGRAEESEVCEQLTASSFTTYGQLADDHGDGRSQGRTIRSDGKEHDVEHGSPTHQLADDLDTRLQGRLPGGGA